MNSPTNPWVLGFLFSAAVITGCARGPSPSATPNRAPVAPPELQIGAETGAQQTMPAGDARSPITAEWRVRKADPKETVLVAQIRREVAFSLPLKVTVRAPAGVTLTRGDASFELAANDGADVTEREYVFSHVGIPTTDVLLEASAQSPAMGVHAEARYSFGRESAPQQGPVRLGPALKVGSKDFGNAVLLGDR